MPSTVPPDDRDAGPGLGYRSGPVRRRRGPAPRSVTSSRRTSTANRRTASPALRRPPRPATSGCQAASSRPTSPATPNSPCRPRPRASSTPSVQATSMSSGPNERGRDRPAPGDTAEISGPVRAELADDVAVLPVDDERRRVPGVDPGAAAAPRGRRPRPGRTGTARGRSRLPGRELERVGQVEVGVEQRDDPLLEREGDRARPRRRARTRPARHQRGGAVGAAERLPPVTGQHPLGRDSTMPGDRQPVTRLGAGGARRARCAAG